MRLAHHPALLRIPAAGALFAGIVCGTLPAVTDGGSIVLAVVAAALISAAGSLLFGRRMATVFAVGALLGICSMEGHRLCAQFSGNYERELPPRSCGGTAELRIIDPRISELPGIVPPSLIRSVSAFFFLPAPTLAPPRPVPSLAIASTSFLSGGNTPFDFHFLYTTPPHRSPKEKAQRF